MEPVLAEDLYTGTIIVDGAALPISFRLKGDADGHLIFDMDPVDPHSYVQLARTMGRPGQEHQHLVLSGGSADGKAVTSDSTYVVGLGSDERGHIVKLAANAARVTLPRVKPAVRPTLQLWLRSFKSFRNSPVETPLGTVVIYGDHRRDGPSDLSGRIVIQARDENADPNWRNQADALLRHIHQGLALAHGGRLQAPVVEYAEGAVTEATFYAGNGFGSEFAVQPFLNHDPFIRALIDRFFLRGPLPEVLWTALGWMQAQTTFDEIRFFTAMTALETIIESQLPDRRGTTVPKSQFRLIRTALEAVIDAAANLSLTAREILKGRISGINKKGFSEKIEALFAHYEIPRMDFDHDTIVNLVKLRNEIVHRGVIPDGIDVWPRIILVRELVVRVLLKELGFVGRYDCYIGGQHTRTFPDCVATE